MDTWAHDVNRIKARKGVSSTLFFGRLGAIDPAQVRTARTAASYDGRMTPVDPFARPEQPDPGARTPESSAGPAAQGDGSGSYDFFAPPQRPGAEPEPYAPEPFAAEPYAPESYPRESYVPEPVAPVAHVVAHVGTQPYDGIQTYAAEPTFAPEPAFMAAPVFTPPAYTVPVPAPQDPPTMELGAPAAPVHRFTPTPTLVELVVPPAPEGDGPGPLYVVGDVHGYLQALLDALHEAGIIDAEGHWSAGPARMWFLGDFTDRGPDGIGVIDLVMDLAPQAAAAGGYCRALMGNHELLLLGADRYGDQAVQSTAGTASFLAAWRLNGGQPSDMDRLQDHHVTWLSRLPAMAIEDDHLLVHSDTTAYLEYGDSVDAVNDAIHDVLQGDEADDWWDCFRRLTRRFAFRGDAGPQACHELLDTFGGRVVVHGHSPIPYLLADGGADDAPAGAGGRPVTGPHVYADGLAVAMDGGVTMEGQGRLLVARLPIG